MRLSVAAGALVVGAFAGTFAPLLVALFIAGAAAAGQNAATGRAVMHWFAREEAVVVGVTSSAAAFALVALAPLAAWSVFGRLS